jgi:predicted RecA/RadA family phage recombinase
MATRFRRAGETFTYTVATTAIVAGEGRVVTGMFGVAQADGAVGEQVEMMRVGVHNLDKDTGWDPAQGAQAFWDDAADEMVASASGAFPIGIIDRAPASGAALADVWLTGEFTTAVP